MAPSKVSLATVFIPQVGLGCWQSPPDETERAVRWALDAGVRLIDTAFFYMNEEAVGKALNQFMEEGRASRKDLFVTTKLPSQAMHPERVERFFEMSRKALGLEYVDLFLLHVPIGCEPDEETGGIKLYDGKVKFTNHDLVEIWKGMEKLVESGRARAIGVSNFNSDQLERISKVAKIPIAVNQVECNAYFQQKKLRETMEKLGIKLMAYAPLGSPGRQTSPGGPTLPRILEDKLVLDLARKHNKTPAQILLRHLIQLGIVVIPKSVREERIKENFDLFDFELSLDEMELMNGLDRGSEGRTFDFNMFPAEEDIREHPEYPIIQRDSY